MVVAPLIKLPTHLRVTDEQFRQLAAVNPDVRLERTAEGELLAMPPTGSEGGNYNAELSAELVNWNRRTRLGKVFDSSTGFQLPNTAIRSPGAAWIAQHRWETLSATQRQGFAPLCPDFVLELASATDDLDMLRAKMREYSDNGCRLGWLIDPYTQQVEIYRPGQPVERLHAPATLSGEAVLPGFTLPLHLLWG